MGPARRGVAAAVATPIVVVIVHALGTLQSAWLGPPIAGAAAAVAVPVVVAGAVAWARPSPWWTAGAGFVAVVALALGGSLPWGLAPLVIAGSVGVGIAATRVAGHLPPSIDEAYTRSRAKAVAWGALALVMVLQVSRLSVFMTDHDNAWGSTFPPIEFTVGHMCMGSYVHAADLTRQQADNIYAPEHYPSFGVSEAEDIDTSIEGVQRYFDDAFLYAPPFLLLPRAWLGLSNDYTSIRSVWFAVQFLTFVAFAIALARWIGGSTGAWALWTLPLVLASMPTMFNFQFGQAHALTIWTALAAMVAFESKRPALGGALLAWGIASKIFPGVLGLYLLFQRRWRDVAWTALFTVVLSLATLLVLGSSPIESFVSYMLGRLASGEAFSFVTDELPIVTNLSIPGTAWKLSFFGYEDGGSLLRPLSWAYTGILVVFIWVGSRIKGDRARLAQLWLAMLILASLRSPIVPIYGAVPILWLMTLELDRVRSTWGLVGFAVSWLFVNGVPPTPNAQLTIALFTVTQLVILFWVIRPFALRERAPEPSPIN
ncbi:MAG: glycosyltransferase family 87 protein [Myxococcota bacterium]